MTRPVRIGSDAATRRLRAPHPALVLPLLMLTCFAARPAQAQTTTHGTVTCAASEDVQFSTDKPQEDKNTASVVGSYVDSHGVACLGNVQGTLKIKIKWYNLQGQEINQSGGVITDPNDPRFEETVLTLDPRGAYGTSTTSASASFDGYYKVWYIKPPNAATAIRSYRLYGSAGSQTAQASASDTKESPSKRTVFTTLPDGTPPDGSPLQ